jgi:hypothetical protein
MMVLAFQLYIGFVLFQGSFMKSIQNTTDHDISIASLKSAVDRLEERIENMTAIQTQGKIFIIRGGRQLGRPCDTELMGREPLCTSSEVINTEPEMECIYSVFYSERVYGVTMILMYSYFKCKDIAMHPSSDFQLIARTGF